MNSYYDTHETAYQQIQSNGFIGWGNARSLDELGDSLTMQFLRDVISTNFQSVDGRAALDIGCGTGTTAFLFSSLGFKTTGIDISPTAIEIAKELSKQQSLAILFEVEDALNLGALRSSFDLVYDSHCLHCIVLEEDRRQFFIGVREILNENGFFVLDTMVVSNDEKAMVENLAPLRFDENWILWHKCKPSRLRGVIELDGQHRCAQRRIYPETKILEEVEEAGFKLVSKRLDLQDGKPSMLRLILSK